ncbi:MAG: hypothetical protein WBD07_09985 [Vicinamibacterales bacterium]
MAMATIQLGAQAAQAARQRAVDAVVARGVKALADGQPEQARATWTLALAFEPGHAEARKQLDALRPAMFALNEEERAFVGETAGKSDSGDWCVFPEHTPEMEVVMLRMLADVRLLPNLRVTNLSFRRAGCDTPGVFIFVARSALSIAQVRQVYGQPQLASTKDNGAEVLTYGHLRIVGTKEGAILSIVLAPLD